LCGGLLYQSKGGIRVFLQPERLHKATCGTLAQTSFKNKTTT